MELKTQICRCCHEEKPITEFYRHPTSKTGYDPRCKACAAKRAKELRQRRNLLTPPDLSKRNPEFAGLQNRELIARMRIIIAELKARGFSYEGELTYLQKIKL